MLAIFGVGYYGLSFMTDTMMKHRSARRNILTFDEAEKKYGLLLKPKEERKLPAETIYERDIKTMNIDDWENKRGPRPWEAGSMGRPEDAKEVKNDAALGFLVTKGLTADPSKTSSATS